MAGAQERGPRPSSDTDRSVPVLKSNLKCGHFIDCKTVRIFAYSSTRQQSNKRCGTRLKTESETTPYGRVRHARFARIRLLRHALPISLLILREKPTVLQSLVISRRCCTETAKKCTKRRDVRAQLFCSLNLLLLL